MNNTQKNILSMLASEYFGVPCVLSDPDWEDICTEAEAQGVICSVLEEKRKLSRTGAAEKVTPKEQLLMAANISRNGAVLRKHAELHQWLSSANIPYVILKGAASASWYPSPILRTEGDVDFYVKEEDIDRAGGVLEAQGLSPIEEIHNAHVAYTRPNYNMEMHFAPPGGWQQGEAGQLIREYMADILEKAVLHTDDNGAVYLPSVFHHGLVMLLHVHSHIIERGIGLRHFCDWVVFANAIPDDEFTGLFEDKLRALGLWRLAQLLTRTGTTYLKAEHKAWAGDGEEDLQAALMEDFLDCGNHGSKNIDKRRYQGALLTSDERNTDAINKGRGLLFISFMNSVVRRNWPFVKKLPFLYPIGWIVFGMRFWQRVIAGKREPLHPAAAMDGLAARQEMCSRLHLFESEK